LGAASSQPRYQDSSPDEYARIAESPQAEHNLLETSLLINLVHRLLTLLHLETEPGSSPSDRNSPEGTIKPGIGSPSKWPRRSAKFANAVKSYSQFNNQLKGDGAGNQQQGLSEKRIEEIYQARKNPQVQPTTTTWKKQRNLSRLLQRLRRFNKQLSQK